MMQEVLSNPVIITGIAVALRWTQPRQTTAQVTVHTCRKRWYLVTLNSAWDKELLSHSVVGKWKRNQALKEQPGPRLHREPVEVLRTEPGSPGSQCSASQQDNHLCKALTTLQARELCSWCIMHVNRNICLMQPEISCAKYCFELTYACSTR